MYRFPLSNISKKLLKADNTERNIYKISLSGYGIHWLIIDEDLSIDSLLKLAQLNHYQLPKVS
ncbi:hypothetical protein GM3709_396 [Geminocystis sp. NIES-3709]|nr:hypothetical protein GM3709_396 [Geminocystis sp. NIES-3709]